MNPLVSSLVWGGALLGICIPTYAIFSRAATGPHFVTFVAITGLALISMVVGLWLTLRISPDPHAVQKGVGE